VLQSAATGQCESSRFDNIQSSLIAFAGELTTRFVLAQLLPMSFVTTGNSNPEHEESNCTANKIKYRLSEAKKLDILSPRLMQRLLKVRAISTVFFAAIWTRFF
jgi:hypothetical protein